MGTETGESVSEEAGPGDRYLGATTSACPVCRRPVPARVHIAGGRVRLRKLCPDHGPEDVAIWSDPASWLDLARFSRPGSVPLRFETAYDGCPGSCGLCPEHEQHVCMPILEVTDHCDLDCPACLVRNRSSFHLTRAEAARILDGLIASEGQVDVLTLSGGEPTLSPEFPAILEECSRRKEILRTSVSTNGRRLTRDRDLLRRIADLDAVVSLQIDGLEDGAHLRLRGRRLLAEKLRLLDLLGQHGVATSLTVTVAAGVNLDAFPAVLDLLFERDHVLSVMVQPLAHAGRAAAIERTEDAVTIPDVLHALDGAAGGLVAASDFSPLPCSHPACFSLSYYLRVEDGFVPVKSVFPADRYLGAIENRALIGTDAGSFEAVRAAVYDLWSGPAALAPDSAKALRAVRGIIDGICGGPCACGYLPRKAMAVAERSIKSVFIHAFMDPHTFDLSRARKCCNVYPQPDGRLVPACVYNCLLR